MYCPPSTKKLPGLKKIFVLGAFFLLRVHLLFSAEPEIEKTSDFYYRVQTAIQSQNLEEFMSLTVTEKDDRVELNQFFQTFLDFKASMPIMQLADEKEDRMVVHVLLQGESETAFQSWNFSIDQTGGKKLLRAANVVSSIDGLFRLKVSSAALPMNNVKITHHDMTVVLKNGHLFVILAGGVPAGAIFLGKGNLLFVPPDPREQHQLVLFNKKATIDVPVTQLFLRASSSTLKDLFGDLDLKKGVSDPKLFEKAQEISRKSNMNAFGIGLPFGDELWFPRLTGADVYSELNTKVGELVYQFAPNEIEDIMLIDREKDRIISLYSSTGSYTQNLEEESQEVLDYKMNLSYNPAAAHLSGSSEIRLLCKEPTNRVVFKLNPSLRVSRIEGSQGSLIYFQERNTNNLHVVLNENIPEEKELTLRFHYRGRIEPDKGRAEVQRISPDRDIDTEYFVPPSFLYSNSAQWYPQLITRPYSTVDVTISVPSDYAAISNGALTKTEKQGDRTVYFYSCEQPVKYFSLLVGRINSSISFESIVPMNIFFYSLDRSNAQQQAESADRILRFYENYFGKYPYSSLNLALRPSHELGGHAPATFVIANRGIHLCSIPICQGSSVCSGISRFFSRT